MTSAFPGWRVVGAAFLIMMASNGFVLYNTAVLLRTLVAQSNFAVDDISYAVAAFFVVSGIAGYAAGALIDTFSARRVILIGAAISSLTFLTLPFLNNIIAIYAFFVVLGVAHNMCGIIPCAALVTRWFQRRRAFAMAVAYNGLSLGGILITPLCGLALHHWGLAGAAVPLALGYALFTFFPALLAIRDHPADVGYGPDGDPPTTQTATPTQPAFSLREAASSRFFIIISLTWFIGTGAQVGTVTHLYNLASERVNVEFAALIFIFLSTASIIGRFVFGYILTRTSLAAVTIVLFLMQCISQGVIALAETPTTLLLATAAFGFPMGTILMLLPLHIAQAFGSVNYGRISGASQAFMFIGCALGPAVVGALRAELGSYTHAFFVAAVGSLVAVAIFLTAPSKKS